MRPKHHIKREDGDLRALCGKSRKTIRVAAGEHTCRACDRIYRKQQAERKS